MSTVPRTVCDICGTMKGEGNHWIVVLKNVEIRAYHVFYYRPAPSDWIWVDLCGEACLHKFVSAHRQAIKSHEGTPDSSGNSNTEGGASTFNHHNAVELNSQGVASAAPAQGDSA